MRQLNNVLTATLASLAIMTCSANATMVTDILSATVTSISGSFTGDDVKVGDYIDLFEVTYDDAGTQYTHTYDDGTPDTIYTLPPPSTTDYTSYSDATYTFSSKIDSLHTEYGGYDAYIVNESYVNQSESDPTNPYRHYHYLNDDMYLMFGRYESTGTLAFARLIFFIGEGQTNEIQFGDPSSLTREPVPEPTTMLLFGTGIVCLAGSRLRKKK